MEQGVLKSFLNAVASHGHLYNFFRMKFTDELVSCLDAYINRAHFQ